MLNIAGQRNISIFSMEACNADTVKYHRVFAISRRNRIFPIFEPSAFLHLHSQFSSLYCFCNYSVEKKIAQDIFTSSFFFFFFFACLWQNDMEIGERAIGQNWLLRRKCDCFWPILRSKREIISQRFANSPSFSNFPTKNIPNVNQVNIYFRFTELTIIPRISSSSFARARKFKRSQVTPPHLGGERVNDVIPKGEAVEFDRL